ncbi:MAG: heavy-metal-associated domain-containing protein [Kofleriaceae bacterium]
MIRWALVAALAAGCGRDEARSAPVATTPAAPAVAPEAPVAPVAPVVRVAPAPPAALTRVTIKALGMYCEESCPLRVRNALADIRSIYELGFDLSTESIFVSYDAALGAPDQVTQPMLAAIKQAGYDPWLSKHSWPADAQAQVVAR